MKHILFTALLTGLALGAGAQNNKKMTKEEKEQTMQGLETLYRMETGKIFDGFDELAVSGPQEVTTLPWDEWMERNKEDYRNFTQFIRGFDHLTMEAVEGDPRACRIVFRSYTDGSGEFSTKMSFGLWEKHYHTDADGNRIGFSKEGFSGLETDIRLHLTDKNGNDVFIGEDALKVQGEKKLQDGRLEVWFGFELPLTCPYSELSAGHIDFLLYGPQEYEWVEIPVAAAKDGAKQVSLGDKTLRLEKTDDKGFVISAGPEILGQLDELEYLYRRDGSWWKPSSSLSMTGSLKDMLEYSDEKKGITFGEWLKKKGIDPDNLESTVRNFMNAGEEHENEPTTRGKRFESGITGDALILYMPVGSARKKILASARIYTPASGKPTEKTVDEALYAELSEQLYRASLKDANVSALVFATAIGKFEYPDIKGAPGELKEGCRLTVQERDALLVPNDRISYAVGVVQAERLMKDPRMEDFLSFFHFPEKQEVLLKGFELGISTCRELFAKAEKKAGEQAESLYSPDADLTELTGALHEASEKAKENGTAYSTAFDYGVDAFGLYRSCAACDLPQIDTTRATGRLLDVPEVRHGFEDYIRKQLKMGVQYASGILLRRAAAVKDLGNRAPADGVNNDQTGYVEDFQMARFLDPASGRPAMMQNVIARIMQRPQELIEQGIGGKVNVEVTIEADGSISKIEVIHSSHPALAEVVADGFYRLRCTPATVGSQSVAMKLSIPVIFSGL